MKSLAASVLSIALATSTAHGGCPIMEGADSVLATHDDAARLAWIRGRLAHTAHRAHTWLRWWEIGIVGGTVVNLAMIPILGNTESNRIDFGLGAATTIIGIVPLLVYPPRVIADQRALETKLAAGGDPCALLADAEHHLRDDAHAQAQQRAWYWHAGNVVLNAGVTLLFGAFHHWGSGIANGIGGALVGELIIYSEPVDLVDDLSHYRHGDLGAPGSTWQLVPTANPQGLGMAFARAF